MLTTTLQIEESLLARIMPKEIITDKCLDCGSSDIVELTDEEIAENFKVCRTCGSLEIAEAEVL